MQTTELKDDQHINIHDKTAIISQQGEASISFSLLFLCYHPAKLPEIVAELIHNCTGS